MVSAFMSAEFVMIVATVPSRPHLVHDLQYRVRNFLHLLDVTLWSSEGYDCGVEAADLACLSAGEIWWPHQ